MGKDPGQGDVDPQQAEHHPDQRAGQELLLGRRLSFGIFVWLARHAPWALQEPEHENSFIKLARQGRPKHDDLLEKVDSKYALVTFASQRARQINDYYNQLGDGILEYVGPLVEPGLQEKPLSIALREINAGLLTAEAYDPEAEAASSFPVE